MNIYQVWTLPENKVKGSHDKWVAHEPVEAKSRKMVTEHFHKTHKNGTWKVRKV